VPAILIAEEESSLICDTINSEEPGKYLIHYIINLLKMINMVKINFSLEKTEANINWFMVFC